MMKLKIWRGGYHIRFVSYDHLHGPFGGILATLRKPPEYGVEGFAIRHVIHLVIDRFISGLRLKGIIRLRTQYYPLCTAIVR
jgi:hypothetical protein